MSDSAVKVLYVNGGTMDRGGISTHMMNYYRHFDLDRIHIDFVVHGTGGVFDSEIQSLGGKVFHVPTKKENLIGNYQAINELLSSKQYKIVHCHMDGMNGPILKLAYLRGIPVRISHSHNTEHLTTNPVKRMVHEWARKQIPFYATHLWACSTAAGKWLYGENRLFEVIPNALDTSTYRYCEKTRSDYRSRYRLNDSFVIGHIGRFDFQKNQEFLINIFSEVRKTREKAVLVLVGDGNDRSKIENQIRTLGLSDRVILLGARNDVAQILNMFDVFVLPSRFEGLGIAAIEAQCSGLHCILSENVPTEARLTNNATYIPMGNHRAWIEALCADYDRECDAWKSVVEKGYDINSAAERLQNRYIEMGVDNH